MWYTDNMDNKYKQTTMWIEPTLYRTLRKLLIDRGSNFSEWVRSKMVEELEKAEKQGGE